MSTQSELSDARDAVIQAGFAAMLSKLDLILAHMREEQASIELLMLKIEKVERRTQGTATFVEPPREGGFLF